MLEGNNFNGMFTDRVMLENHLIHNLYPSVSLVFADAAEAAIVACAEDEPDKLIDWPNTDGGKVVAHEIVEGMNLNDFVAMLVAGEDY